MAEFPKLKTDAVSQYPSARELSFSTSVSRFVDGKEQRFRNFKSCVQGWILQMSAIDSNELNSLREFFETQQGRFGSFSFTDPWDGTEHPDCSLAEDSFDARMLDESNCNVRLIIRKNRT